MSVNKLLAKIDRCIDYYTLYALEDDFNRAGLTIQTTGSNRVILCKLRDGRPLTKAILDDYIFIGTVDEANKELSDRTLGKITDFIRNAAGKADKVRSMQRSWRNGLHMYEASIAIMNEDINFISDAIEEGPLYG